MTEPGCTPRWRRALLSPVDAAGLVAFRVLFGLLMAFGLARFVAQGWIEVVFVQPDFFFSYPGFEWVKPWSRAGMYAHFGALFVLALCVAAGLFYRLAVALLLVGFAYVQLIDVTNYLNHYYLVVLLLGLMLLLPLGDAGSFDARRDPRRRRTHLPAWMQYLLRFQVAVVYLGAALAKFGPDWLLLGEPMTIWMRARADLPLLGPVLAEPTVALGMSWAGFLYDATIVGFLLHPRTRPFAYVAVLAFHGMTWALFDIGMFPFIMAVATTVFFSPSWPRRWLRRLGPAPEAPAARLTPRRPRALLGALAAYAVVQVFVPLRANAYEGDVLWHEQGMRWSWRVMVREKNASVTYHVRNPATGRQWQVSPHRYLTWRQANEMSGQPDLILQLAHHVAADFARRGHPGVEVRAEVWASLNGRPPALLLDPERNLAAIEDGLAPADWITRAPGADLGDGGRARIARTR